MNEELSLETIVSLCKRRGFIYQGSEIYGGLAGTWDYGPLGVALKRNIMTLWWKMFVEDRDDMYGLDTAILMNAKVWEASGHADTFTDPVTICLNCNNRFRVDKIIDEAKYKEYIEDVLTTFLKKQEEQYQDEDKLVSELDTANVPLRKQAEDDLKEWKKLIDADVSLDVYRAWLEKAVPRINKATTDMKTIGKKYSYLTAWIHLLMFLREQVNDTKQYIGEYAQIYLDTFNKCPVCGAKEWNVPRRFNMMFKTNTGPVQDESSATYLRPETAQGMFVNFKNILDSFSPDLPFGLAQIGRNFRNEISPRDFVFRAREFEIMELEYFISPADWEKHFEAWRKTTTQWFAMLGLSEDKLKEIEVPEEDRAHYSKRTIDFHYKFPSIGFDELSGLAYRTDFDLKNHQEHSGKKLEYRPKDGGEPFIPHVIEPTYGLDRNFIAVISNAYTEDEVNGEKRAYLKLPSHLAPVKVAVSPLLKNKPELATKAREVYKMLKAELGAVMYDDNGNIGKRYRRQDEIGTPYCVTIDFDTLKDDTVTVRERDTTKQQRAKINSLKNMLEFIRSEG